MGKPAGAGPAVCVHAFFDKDYDGEAARVVEIVRDARERDPLAKIAVLVRARTHLPAILRALRRAEPPLRYRAVEIDQLGEIAITQDLLALTRALLHPADRVAWLAILRAPWCGLTLADLDALAADAPRDAVWDLLRDESRVERLSEDGQARLGRILPVLGDALARRGTPLRAWIEACWTALGGPACATEPGDFENALAFLDLIETLDEGGDTSIDALAEEAGRLFAAPVEIDRRGTLAVDLLDPHVGIQDQPPKERRLVAAAVGRERDVCKAVHAGTDELCGAGRKAQVEQVTEIVDGKGSGLTAEHRIAGIRRNGIRSVPVRPPHLNEAAILE